MEYETKEDIEAIIKAFETCTVERGEWGHPEHLILAYHYATNHDFENAYEKMKAGIFKLLDSFGVDVSKEMPYHETMTVFWMKTVYGYAASNPEITVETVNEMIKRFDKHYPGRYYSNDLLMSDRARAGYIEPDINPIDD